jgi:predicted O-methyltransferase YrrM
MDISISVMTISLKTPINDALYQYVINNSVREHNSLINIKNYTAGLGNKNMLTPPDQACFMGLIAQIINAKKYLEIGVFTGYSALNMALSMGADSITFALENNPSYIEIACKFWQEAGYHQQIKPIIGDALSSLRKLCSQEDQLESFDLAFIDANKSNYPEYYEYCYNLVRPNGIIMIDNVLMHGKILEPNPPKYVAAINSLNRQLYNDPRVNISMLTLGDGLTIVHKLAIPNK